jgi:hypothetical protein
MYVRGGFKTVVGVVYASFIDSYIFCKRFLVLLIRKMIVS